MRLALAVSVVLSVAACSKRDSSASISSLTPSEQCTEAAKVFAKMWTRCAPTLTYDQGFNMFVEQFVDAGNYAGAVKGCAAVKYVDAPVIQECMAQFGTIDCARLSELQTDRCRLAFGFNER